MKFKKWWISGLFVATFLFLVHFSYGQSSFAGNISGQVLARKGKEPVPFANVFNETTAQGVISASDGSFSMKISGLQDQIRITCIGFRPYVLKLMEGQAMYTILIEENVQVLAEVVIAPRSNAYLFDLIQNARKNGTGGSTAKSYYQLKTYKDGDQVELVEGFFNSDLRGYDIEKLRFKTGRIALRPFDGTFFTSQAGSKAISEMRVAQSNAYFPASPLEMGARKGAKHFDLELEKKVLDEHNDSIYVINYRPLTDRTKSFSGSISINKSRGDLLKVHSKIANAGVHPFLPLFPSDRILGVDIDIVKSFERVGEEVLLNRVNFSYNVRYLSRIGDSDEFAYELETHAVIFAYDYGTPFFEPLYDLSSGSTFDYRLVNAFPHNEFFWANHNEYVLADIDSTNQSFYMDPASFTNQTFHTSTNTIKNRLYEYPYIHWNGNRLRMRDMLDTTKVPEGEAAGIKALQYQLEVKLFMDVNTYGDSTHVLTSTVFDPYETYYNLPMDRRTTCFINMYFDICEMYRRRLENGLKELSDPELYNSYYAEVLGDMHSGCRQFLSEVERGTSFAAMVRWNSLIIDTLGIDNMRYFNLTSESYEPGLAGQ